MADNTLQLKLLHGLANPTRYQILKQLQLGESSVTALVEHVDASQSSVSQHLACLTDCGLIKKRTVGKYYLYSLSTPAITTLLDLVETTSHDFAWTSSTTIACTHNMA